MSRFYVGQRVRILWSNGWPELGGRAGVIVGRAFDRGLEGISEWRVAPDCWGTHEAPRVSSCGGLHFAPCSDQLAPAYDGNETVAWSECLWQPQPERVA
jgi:hypothetical protein